MSVTVRETTSTRAMLMYVNLFFIGYLYYTQNNITTIILFIWKEFLFMMFVLHSKTLIQGYSILNKFIVTQGKLAIYM